jgi:hypothetical protein
MFELKPISREAIPEALAKAERYRLLNEPAQAESICEDVLRVDPDNQEALVMLLLAQTEQFVDGLSAAAPKSLIPRLQHEYQRNYYSGIICERRARALINQQKAGAGFTAYDWFRQAMEWYEKAETCRPPNNDEALLRWNTCVRSLERNPHLQPRPEERPEPVLSE